MDKKDSKIVVIKSEKFEYFRKPPFRPTRKYKETPFDETGEGENHIYDMVRSGFCLMGYDIEKYDTEDWNPLGIYIKPGDTVVLKPNMVMDVNGIVEEGTDCLYTQPSIVAAVLDFVIIALKGNGRIIVGDAPMQECNFEKLVKESGYLDMIHFLQKKLKNKQIEISLVDFRELRSVVKEGLRHSSTNRYEFSGDGAIIVDLGNDSEFSGLSEYSYDNIRITNYDPSLLKEHHNATVNEYKVSKEILSADVVINLPKPKVHRKGGVTIALKNLVGINCRKEYLPHHTNGSIEEGGDEYLYKSRIKRLADYFYDKRNYHMQTTKKLRIARFFQILAVGLWRLTKYTKNDPYKEGSWYGNDTISKTLVDLNKILLYADKNGNMQQTPQRKVIIVADMVVSGEKEGPVCPSPKNVGMITFGEDPVCFDEAMATLMGAKLKYIHSIIRARNLKGKYSLTQKGSKPYFISNLTEYNKKHIEDLDEKDILYFIPTTGWEKAFNIKET